jgi:hypothetical protein
MSAVNDGRVFIGSTAMRFMEWPYQAVELG